ncbi:MULTISPECIES: hypothetical protein [Mycobacteriaceae]|uniref:Uncharacterized protein n=1 Tax=Mycolicibacterium neoaurum VKM Ac-1815D TaxID=700508 RepID=V5XJ53_MYCNE|nr:MULTISPECIES: hypothetical protein [Mycobacteriaceae]
MPSGKGVYVDDENESEGESSGQRAAERAERGDPTPDVPDQVVEPPD